MTKYSAKAPGRALPEHAPWRNPATRVPWVRVEDEGMAVPRAWIVPAKSEPTMRCWEAEARGWEV